MNSIERAAIEGEPIGQRAVEQHGLQAHRGRAEQSRVHGPGIAHQRAEVHEGQDVPLQIDARCHLDQCQPAGVNWNTQRSVPLADDLLG